MAALGSYNPAGSTSLDRARRALGDIGGSKPFTFADAEISDWISDRGSWQGAVAEGFRALAGAVARNAQDFSNAQGSVNQTANYDLLKQQADDWDKRAEAATASTPTIPKAIIRALGTAPSDPYDTRS